MSLHIFKALIISLLIFNNINMKRTIVALFFWTWIIDSFWNQKNPETIDEIYEIFKAKYDKVENKTKFQKVIRRRLADEFNDVLTVEQTMMTFSPTSQESTYLQTEYFPIANKAKQDSNNYSSLTYFFQQPESKFHLKYISFFFSKNIKTFEIFSGSLKVSFCGML